MSKANLTHLNATDQDINMMPVSYAYFAEYASLYGRMYGVLTGDDRGLTGPDGEVLQSFVANNCIRRAIYQGLLRVSQEAEKAVGYKLSERYFVATPEAWRGEGKVLLIPGIEAVEVEQNWYEIPEDNFVTLNYYAEENLTLEADGDLLFARISQTIFENPKFAILRNLSDNPQRRCFVDEAHPRYAEEDSGDWLLPLATNIVNVEIADIVSAYHLRDVTVVVTKPDISSLPEGGIIAPVYPGSNQAIPHEVVAEDDTEITYRFNVWVLVKPAFVDETVDWERFETRKLYSEIELRYVVEEPAYLRMVWTEGNDQYTYQYDPDDPDADDLPRLEVILAQPSRGIVHLYANDELICDLHPYWQRACGCKRQKMPESVALYIPIKVSVESLTAPYRGQVDQIREAILARVAAELPMENCGCKNNVGFIAEQQREYGSAYMNPFTGVEVVKTDFGKRHGQRVYWEAMQKVRPFRKPVRVGGV